MLLHLILSFIIKKGIIMFAFHNQQVAEQQAFAQLTHDQFVREHNEQFQRQLLANPSEAPAEEVDFPQFDEYLKEIEAFHEKYFA